MGQDVLPEDLLGDRRVTCDDPSTGGFLSIFSGIAEWLLGHL